MSLQTVYIVYVNKNFVCRGSQPAALCDMTCGRPRLYNIKLNCPSLVIYLLYLLQKSLSFFLPPFHLHVLFICEHK